MVKGFCGPPRCPLHPSGPSPTQRTLLTVSGFLLIRALVLVLGVDVLCLSDPVQVAFQVLFQLLLLAQLLEISPSLGLLPLFGKLSGEREWSGWSRGARGRRERASMEEQWR